MSCILCSDLGVPDHLCSFDKDLNIPFEDNEKLYRRISNEFPQNTDEITSEHLKRMFPLDRDSYNRSELSNPEDVFIDDKGIRYDNHHCIILPINSVNTINHDVPDNNKNSRIFSLVVRYDVLDCNYSHCEIDCYMDGNKIDPKKNPPSAKLFMRDQLKRIISYQ